MNSISVLKNFDTKLQSSKEGANSKSSNIFGKKNKTEIIKALSVNKKKKCISKFSRGLKEFDEYGEKVEFTFKGKKHYGTLIGGIFTIAVRAIIITYLAYEIYVLFTRKYVNTYNKSSFYD